MAPTTMPGQVTTTSPAGRDPAKAGFPMRMCELLATLRTPAYVVRASVHTPQLMVQTKRAIRRAFELQAAGSLLHLRRGALHLPHQLGHDARSRRLEWLEENMLPYYPLGVFKDPDLPETQEGLVPIPLSQQVTG